jgi:membrane associated rhomboid family serine protease
MFRDSDLALIIIDIILVLLVIAGMFYCSYFGTIPPFNISKFSLSYLADLAPSQYYRFITANFAHFNWQHLIENAIGFVIIWFIPRGTNAGNWPIKILAFVFIGLFTTITLFYLTDVANRSVGYAGLSGLLHGLLVFNCLYIIKDNKSSIPYLILIGICIKIFIDIYYPNLTFHKLSQDLYDNAQKLQNFIQDMNPRQFRVSYESHIAGSVGGIILFIIINIYQKLFTPKLIK